jgi:hypothetical protein
VNIETLLRELAEFREEMATRRGARSNGTN